MSPVYLSWFNFLHGDPALRDAVIGLPQPARERDEFRMDIETTWGVPLSVTARLQMNVKVVKDSYSGLSGIQESVFLPFVAIEEGVPGPNQSMLEGIRFILGIGDTVKNISVLCGILLGLVCMLPEIILWIRSCNSGKSQDVKKQQV